MLRLWAHVYLTGLYVACMCVLLWCICIGFLFIEVIMYVSYVNLPYRNTAFLLFASCLSFLFCFSFVPALLH